MTLQLNDFTVRGRPVRSGRALGLDFPEQTRANIQNAEIQISESSKGITDGRIVPDLFSLQKTDLSNGEMKRSADALVDSLGPSQL